MNTHFSFTLEKFRKQLLIYNYIEKINHLHNIIIIHCALYSEGVLYTLHLQCLLLKIVFIAPSTYYYYILFKHNHCQSMTQYMYHVTTPTDVQYVATML